MKTIRFDAAKVAAFIDPEEGEAVTLVSDDSGVYLSSETRPQAAVYAECKPLGGDAFVEELETDEIRDLAEGALSFSVTIADEFVQCGARYAEPPKRKRN